MTTYRHASTPALRIQLAADRRNARCEEPEYARAAERRVRAIEIEIARRQGARA